MVRNSFFPDLGGIISPNRGGIIGQGGIRGVPGRMVRNSFFQIWGDNLPMGGKIGQGG